MRQLLINYAEHHQAAKRGGCWQRVSLGAVEQVLIEREADLIALDEALRGLERLDPEQSRVVELHFFGGLTMEEIAEVMGRSVRTVKREWSTARAWLRREMSYE